MYRHSAALKLLFPLPLDGVHLADLELEGAWLDHVHARAENLLLEMVPGRCNETLGNWERVLGLPDPCTGPLPTMQLRRAAVAAKDAAGGGLSRAYFIQLAADLGYPITITEFKPFAAGSVAGDDLTNGDWIYTWQVNAEETTTWAFLAGAGRAGEPLSLWGLDILECAFRRLKPAHSHVNFAYGG